MDKIEIGNWVRVYDNLDILNGKLFYCDGIVTEISRADSLIDYDRYRIEVYRRVWNGKEIPGSFSFVYVPANGTPRAGGGGVYNLVVHLNGLLRAVDHVTLEGGIKHVNER